MACTGPGLRAKATAHTSRPSVRIRSWTYTHMRTHTYSRFLTSLKSWLIRILHTPPLPTALAPVSVARSDHGDAVAAVVAAPCSCPRPANCWLRLALGPPLWQHRTNKQQHRCAQAQVAGSTPGPSLRPKQGAFRRGMNAFVCHGWLLGAGERGAASHDRHFDEQSRAATHPTALPTQITPRDPHPNARQGKMGVVGFARETRAARTGEGGHHQPELPRALCAVAQRPCCARLALPPRHTLTSTQPHSTLQPQKPKGTTTHTQAMVYSTLCSRE